MHIASPTYLPYVPLVNHMLYSALHLRYAWRGVPQLPKRGGLLVSTVLPEATQNTRSIQHWMAVKCPESFATCYSRASTNTISTLEATPCGL